MRTHHENEKPAATNSDPSEFRVLYVDDEPKALKYFVKTFSADFDIVTAGNAAQAIDILDSKDSNIGVLITDQRMPVTSGVDLLKQTRARWPNIVTLLITAYLDIDDAIDAINKGQIFQYIHKPWNQHKLKIKLLEAIQKYTRNIYNLQLAEMNERLEEANNIQTQFINMLSHEVRTPINVSINLADYLLETPLTDEQRDNITSIKIVNDNLAHLLDNTLDYSKWSAGKLKLSYMDFQLDVLLSQLSHTFKLQFAAAELRYSFSIDSEINPSLRGDPDRLLQVLINLVSNAIKFTPSGGEVRVEVSLVEESDRTAKLRFSVKDTGSGIAPEALENLFKPYSQTQQEKRGTGLGLSITKELVTMMGGEIGLSTEQKQGSEFWFSIILGKQHSQQKQADFSQPCVSQNKTVLLADDNRINRLMVHDLLSRYGYSVDIAEDGDQALAMAEGQQYSVILMDCQMPQMDGLEATAKIRKCGRNEKTPVIALTAMPENMLKGRWQEAGIDDYISKPFERFDFLETIRYWTDRAG